MNYRSDRDTGLEINFNNICVISRHFEVKQLQGQLISDDVSSSLIPIDDNPKPSPLKVGWQERVTLHYLVAPVAETDGLCNISMLPFLKDGNASLQDGSATFSDISLGVGKLTDFICRERAHDVFSVSVSD